MNILPEDVSLNTEITETIENDELPEAKEYAWDFDKNDFVYENGRNKVVEGIDAVKIWIYKILKTPRYKYMAYTWDYGNEFEALTGRRYSEEYLKSEAERLIKDCLLVNPYITGISNLSVDITGKKLTIEFTANTVYGEVGISV